VPKANLAVSTTYYCRVRYTSGTGGGGVVTTSAYSASAYNWATGTTFVPPIGTSMCGGYFGGQISTAGNGIADYNLIVSPQASGQVDSGIYEWKTSNTSDGTLANSTVYGYPASNNLNDAAHPGFQWVRSLSIGGYTDWYIPAFYEYNVLYYYLKPGTSANNPNSTAAVNANPYAVSPQPTSAPTTTNPDQTSVVSFRWLDQFATLGPESFEGPGFSGYLTATQADQFPPIPFTYGSSGDAQGWTASRGDYDQGTGYPKTTKGCFRAIRRIPV
jgi:hypothetical protein